MSPACASAQFILLYLYSLMPMDCSALRAPTILKTFESGGISMIIHNSCKSAIQSCLDTKTFAAAHLYNDEKTMSIHIHDCYEIYYSISGGKQFLIDNRFYDFQREIFFINQYESHYLSQIDRVTHERIVLSVYPDFLKRFSTENTDLNYCFTFRDTTFGHKLSLSPEEQKRFLYYIHKLSEKKDFGQDILEQTAFLELMIYLNRIFLTRCEETPKEELPAAKGNSAAHSEQINAILSYVNLNLEEELTIQKLASHFFLSSSYLCRIFKDETGTTINRYITAKRITRAKELLADGYSVTETYAMCGFQDYSNFLKAFTKAVGISPKKYAMYEQ